jgi:hypothetical protein
MQVLEYRVFEVIYIFFGHVEWGWTNSPEVAHTPESSEGGGAPEGTATLLAYILWGCCVSRSVRKVSGGPHAVTPLALVHTYT